MKVFKTIKPMKYTQWIVILFCLIGMTACRQDVPRFRIGVLSVVMIPGGIR